VGIMDFWVSPLWYVFLFASLIAFTLQMYGHQTDGTKSRWLDQFAGLFLWIIFILTFIFVGWIGGIASLILFFLLINKIGHWLAFKLFKLVRPEAKYLTYKLFQLRARIGIPEKNESLDKLMKRSQAIDEMASNIQGNPVMLKFLQSIGQDQEKINEIYESFASQGLSFQGMCVIGRPQMINEYIELEASGYDEEDINYHFFEALGS